MTAKHRTREHRRDQRLFLPGWKRNPNTRCWRCGRLANEHPLHKTGRRGSWTVGHDGPRVMGAEWSTCNFEAGAVEGNDSAEQNSREW